ncbi:unnamed protein product [Phytophthora fragariaefolia]|uniref:Unnamed protein product n=1 Tax=Phytophthora fragariaefolia TaxID=1490495 RepID=A0A9W6X6Q1_9STRA|nr:unnamed protein product [Phytophthora fragariaefolia]
MSEDAAAMEPAPRASAKRKRVVLSIHDKQQVLQRLEGGEPPVAIARAFGISRQQVSDIKKNRERIVAFCVDAKHLSTLKRKTLRASSEYHPGVEQELYRWLVRQRRLGRHVAADALASKAADLFALYAAHGAHTPFKAVAIWLRHFKKAHGIKTLADDELSHLPEQFVPAMEMTRPGDVAATPSQPLAADAVAMTLSIGTPVTPSPPLPSGNYFINTTGHGLAPPIAGGANGISMTTTTSAAGVSAALDMNTYIHEIGVQASGQQLQVHVGGPTASLQTTASMVQQLNAQLARFEQDMAAKLDYLDDRVTKLCLLALPARLS